MNYGDAGDSRILDMVMDVNCAKWTKELECGPKGSFMQKVVDLIAYWRSNNTRYIHMDILLMLREIGKVSRVTF